MSSESAGERSLVLVVEDDPAASELLDSYLTDSGFNVTHAYNGREAVELAKRLKPSAITLDVMLPEKSGWEVLAELKSNAETRQIPVIIVSITAEHQLGYSLGAVECLRKPVSKEEFLEVVRRAQNSSPSPLKRVLLIEDDPMELDLLSKSLENEGFEALQAIGGQQGIELATEHRPDLIILDLLMPRVNGFEVVERLQSDARTRGIPILVHTSMDLSEEDRQQLNRHVLAITSKTGKENLLRELQRYRKQGGFEQEAHAKENINSRRQPVEF